MRHLKASTNSAIGDACNNNLTILLPRDGDSEVLDWVGWVDSELNAKMFEGLDVVVFPDITQ